MKLQSHGITIAVFGLMAMLAGMLIDPSIDGRFYNLHKAHRLQLLVWFGGMLFVGGIVLAGLAALKGNPQTGIGASEAQAGSDEGIPGDETSWYDYYAAIGVDRRATQDEIDRRCIELGQAYLKQKEDGNPLASMFLAQVEDAYEHLGKPDARRKYDRGIQGKAESNDPATKFAGVLVNVLVIGTLLIALYFAFRSSQY